MEMIACPHCNRLVPESNLALHEVTCQRGNKRNFDDTLPIRPSQSSEEEGQPRHVSHDKGSLEDETAPLLPHAEERDQHPQEQQEEQQEIVELFDDNSVEHVETGIDLAAEGSSEDESDTKERRREEGGRKESPMDVERSAPQHQNNTNLPSLSPWAAAASAATQRFEAANTSASTQEWACPSCTLLNPHDASYCDACHYIASWDCATQRSRTATAEGGVRVPDSTRRERLIDLTQESDNDGEVVFAGVTRSTSVQQQQQQQQYSPGILTGGGALLGSIVGGASALLRGRNVGEGALNGAVTGAAGGAILGELFRDTHINASSSTSSVSSDGRDTTTTTTTRSNGRTTTTTTIHRNDLPIAVAWRADSNVQRRNDSNQARSRVRIIQMDRNGMHVINGSPDPMMEMYLRTMLLPGQAAHRPGTLFVPRVSGPMNVDVDQMSYEQLLALLGDGTENRGADARTINAFPVSTVEEPGKLPEDKRSCAICLSDFEKGEQRKMLPCLHGFHQGCIDQWLERNATCPVCKHEVRER